MMANDSEMYPVTIIRTRYGGVYEGGPWAALDCSHDEVPEAAIGDDVACVEFWALARAGEYEIRDWRAWAEAPGRPHPTERPGRILHVGAGREPGEALEVLLQSRGEPT